MSSIKQQIRDYYVALLAPLKTTINLRGDPLWSNDPTQLLNPLPSLLLYAGDDIDIAADSRGRTREFHITNKFCFAKGRESDMQTLHETVVAALTMLVEGDIQLGGLADIVDQRDVESFLLADGTTAVLLVSWRVQYRHALAQPALHY